MIITVRGAPCPLVCSLAAVGRRRTDYRSICRPDWVPVPFAMSSLFRSTHAQPYAHPAKRFIPVWSWRKLPTRAIFHCLKWHKLYYFSAPHAHNRIRNPLINRGDDDLSDFKWALRDGPSCLAHAHLKNPAITTGLILKCTGVKFDSKIDLYVVFVNWRVHSKCYFTCFYFSSSDAMNTEWSFKLSYIIFQRMK